MKKLDKMAEKLKVQLREARIMSNDLGFKLGLIQNLCDHVGDLAVSSKNKAVIQLVEELQGYIRQAHATAIDIANNGV